MENKALKKNHPFHRLNIRFFLLLSISFIYFLRVKVLNNRKVINNKKKYYIREKVIIKISLFNTLTLIYL